MYEQFIQLTNFSINWPPECAKWYANSMSVCTVSQPVRWINCAQRACPSSHSSPSKRSLQAPLRINGSTQSSMGSHSRKSHSTRLDARLAVSTVAAISRCRGGGRRLAAIRRRYKFRWVGSCDSIAAKSAGTPLGSGLPGDRVTRPSSFADCEVDGKVSKLAFSAREYCDT